jgi:hypothetical protein
MKKKALSTFLISLLLVGGAFAAPTAQIVSGLTTVDLSPEFLEAINSLNITPSAVAPATVNLQGGQARFPVSGGAIDLSNLSGDIFHNGGLALEVTGTKASLLNFIIDLTGESPVLTGLVAVNDDIVDRIDLFNLQWPQMPQESENGTVVISDIDLTLTQTAADTLNNAFGTTGFAEGLTIGSAVVTVQTWVLGPIEHQ